jgi:hypothetical protein
MQKPPQKNFVKQAAPIETVAAQNRYDILIPEGSTLHLKRSA